MASVNDGIQVLSFGTTTITGYVVENISESTTSEEIEIQDEDGQFVAHINAFGVKTAVDITVIPKTTTTAPSIGDTFTYTSETHGATQKFTITELPVVSSNKDVTRWNLKGNRYPDITIT